MVTTLAAVAIFLFCSGRAYAYLDPGTGSFVLQVAIATFVAAGAAIKLSWYRIKAACHRLVGNRHEKRDDGE